MICCFFKVLGIQVIWYLRKDLFIIFAIIGLVNKCYFSDHHPEICAKKGVFSKDLFNLKESSHWRSQSVTWKTFNIFWFFP